MRGHRCCIGFPMDDAPRNIGVITVVLGRQLLDFSQDIARNLRQTSQRLTQTFLPASDIDGNVNQFQAVEESRHSAGKKARFITPLETFPGTVEGKLDSGRKAAARTASKISSNGADLAERQKLPRIKTKPQVDRNKVGDGQRRHRSGVRGIEIVTVSADVCDECDHTSSDPNLPHLRFS